MAENELVRVEGESAGYMTPVMTVQQALARYQMLQEISGKLLREGEDFGVIPGTTKEGEKPKKNLLKPGAEKLASFFGLVPVFEDAGSIVDFPTGLFHYAKTCVLLRNARLEVVDGKKVITGDVVSTATSSCNSREKKYRRGARICPTCGAATIRRSKTPPRDNPHGKPGWFCWAKEGGCGANFAADEEEITKQSMTIDPLSAADQANTILRMAEKRSLVAAVLLATNASNLFTQDMEDRDQGDGSDEDAGGDPGNAPASPRRQPAKGRTITLENAGIIESWLKHHKLSASKFCQHYKITRVADLPEREFNVAYDKAKTGFAAWKPDAPAPSAPATPSTTPPPADPYPHGDADEGK